MFTNFFFCVHHNVCGVPRHLPTVVKFKHLHINILIYKWLKIYLISKTKFLTRFHIICVIDLASCTCNTSFHKLLILNICYTYAFSYPHLHSTPHQPSQEIYG